MRKTLLVTVLVLVFCFLTSAAAQDTDVENVYKIMAASFTERDLEKRWVPHTDLVLDRAKQLLRVVKADSNTVLIGAILHDIGKGTEDHEKEGAKIAGELLEKSGFDKNFIQIIYRIVENHHKAQCEHTDEFKVIWLADQLRIKLPENENELLKVYKESTARLKTIMKR
ncbi:HD domain-containing protein [candidate division KSB1 bacterium]